MLPGVSSIPFLMGAKVIGRCASAVRTISVTAAGNGFLKRTVWANRWSGGPQPLADDTGQNWAASASAGGTPGRVNSALAQQYCAADSGFSAFASGSGIHT